MSVRWRIWLRWSLSSLVGVVAGVVLFILVGVLASAVGAEENAPQVVFGMLFGATFGAPIGLAQARVLRRVLGQTTAWAAATTIGMVAGAGIVFGVFDDSGMSETTKALIHPPVLAVTIGAAQWAVIRGRLRHAAWWFPAALVAWACGDAVSRLLMRLDAPPAELIGLILVPQLVLGLVPAYLLPTSAEAGVPMTPAGH